MKVQSVDTKKILFVAKLGDRVLAIHSGDSANLPANSARVWCVPVDLRKKEIGPVWELDKHLKFNPWEEILSEEERLVIGKTVNRVFSDADITSKIVEPLEEKFRV